MSKPTPLAPGHIYLGDYLITRLSQLGVKVIFGVPGDFNLAFLDLIEDSKLEWIGNCNELNAAYAADGYARVKQVRSNFTSPAFSFLRAISLTPASKIKSQLNHSSISSYRGLGVILTTFGVGELSAMNGIAGAFAERVPVLHIVGAPSTVLQKRKALLHHTLGDGRYNVFEQASQGVTVAQAVLKDARGATEEIDRVLREAVKAAKPSYLTFPTDLVFAHVDASLLETPILDLTLPVQLSVTEKDKEAFVVSEITRIWDLAKNPVFLIDACALRYGVTDLAQELIKSTGAMYFSTPMGKGGLSEDPAKGFGGIYMGSISHDDVKARFEEADLAILIGSISSDFNTGEFTYTLKADRMIELHSDSTVVQYATYPGVNFHTVLPALITSLSRKPHAPLPPHALTIPSGPSDKVITQEAFWPLWARFLKPRDIMVAETGTSSFGVLDVPLPEGGILVSQVLYGSIGWATGATLGVLLAAKEAERERRTILFTGDGSIQLTVQEIATMLRQGLKPIICVLNNDGYAIERLIHGPTRVYNDISNWKWQSLLDFFNADGIPHRSWLAQTRGEFEAILNDPEFAKADRCQLLEVKMDKLDGPRALIQQAALSAKINEEM